MEKSKALYGGGFLFLDTTSKRVKLVYHIIFFFSLLSSDCLKPRKWALDAQDSFTAKTGSERREVVGGFRSGLIWLRRALIGEFVVIIG